MKFSSVWNPGKAGLAVLVLAAAFFGRAQYSPAGSAGSGQSFPNSRASQGGLNGSMDTDPVFLAKRQQALNADRQKSMVSDADKLVKLARELDAEVASNQTDQMTPAELHKVAEIEKLAHNVKAKMAQSFTGGPQLQQSPAAIGSPRLD